MVFSELTGKSGNLKLMFLDVFCEQGTYRFINNVIETKNLPLLRETKGSIDFRAVGKVDGNSSPKFLAHFAYLGGYRRD